jgi:aryl-phospho-beta-D-glucosidase BglC (GH1 family)
MARRRYLGIIAAVVVLVVVAGALTYALTRTSNPPTATPPTGTTPTVPSTSTPTQAGFLRASGTKIIDSSGAPVQLTGYNVTGMESTNPDGSDIPGKCNNAWRPLTSSEVQQIAGYGFNAVRLPIAWGNLEPTAPTLGAGGALVHHWNTAYVAALDSEIAQLGQAHLVVVLDMHQSSWSSVYVTPPTSKKPGCPGSGMPTWLNPSGTATTPQVAACNFYSGRTEAGVPGSAWSDFAAAESYIDGHYTGDSVVVAQDIVNEPYCGKSTANLTGFYEAVVPAIHQANPNILLMLEDRETPGSFKLTHLPSVSNVVLSIHLHEDYWTAPSAGQNQLPTGGQAALAANVARAQAWNVPLYIGEFYAFDATGNQNGNKQPDGNWASDTAKFLSYAKSNNIGWAYWAWIQKTNPLNQPEVTPAVQAALQAG